jgi:hypothetical protein
VYRNIWEPNSSESPAVGDYVENEYGERGIVLAIRELMVYIGIFHNEPEYLTGSVPLLQFADRWEVRR